MELVVFTINAIAIYVLADWLLTRLEKWRGKVLAQRQVLFFVIFLLLALLSFSVIQAVLSPPPIE